MPNMTPLWSGREKTMTEIETLKEKLSRLSLKAMAQHLDSVLIDAAQKNLSIASSLNRLADLELERRWQSASKT